MLSARSLFREIHDDDEAFQLFCSIAAKGEDQGGWENGRISALVRDPELAPKIARHGADEDKHGRIFKALLHQRGLEEVPVPDDTDYTMSLERQGIGLSHARLCRAEELTEHDVIAYLAHSRVTEQRAAEQMRLLKRIFGGHPGVGRAIRMISADEDNHLAFCHEELLRLAAAGHGRLIRDLLEHTARAEIRTYRDVSLAVMSRMGRILRWPRPKTAVLTAGIRTAYAYELAAGRLRMVTLAMPERRNALGGPAPLAAEFG
ncbi:ferritin-like domain-containing protein [Streptantibioticus silvisoli]|uniref:Ferritin-like domain-containing protein n=1 Tax=Streptantibioticus silvisoli TaxID=2705255 RepID=A0ABT6W9E4_9ACTN|nr:ferritin-like domain-containing protein [Streptantibioticus silvisoli]MDI5967355.1 ferritin-like domain-containing protein [Streptantibioticus silvisoli]